MRVIQVKKKLNKSHDDNTTVGDNTVLYENQRKTTHKSQHKTRKILPSDSVHTPSIYYIVCITFLLELSTKMLEK